MVKSENPNDCWGWTASVGPWGYGTIRYGNRMRVASRISWTLTQGEIPDGMKVLHKCDNPACTNPSHLYLGTDAENTIDKMSRNRDRKARGACNLSSILDDYKARQAYELVLSGVPVKTVAAYFGVSRPVVRSIMNGTTWRHVTGLPQADFRRMIAGMPEEYGLDRAGLYGGVVNIPKVDLPELPIYKGNCKSFCIKCKRAVTPGKACKICQL